MLSRQLVLAAFVTTQLAACGARTSLTDESANEPQTCATCASDACVDLYAQCEQSQGCYAAYQCVLDSSGNDALCLCNSDPDDLVGQSAYRALARCLEESTCSETVCGVVCQSESSGAPRELFCGIAAVPPACPSSRTATLVGSTAACDACVASSCASFAGDCALGSECLASIACLAACDASDCANTCKATLAAGQTAAEALDVCVGGACETECSF
jgi:hypothetical protein